MSTYEQLKGLKVKYLSADTSGDRSVEGELFYNSSDFGLKSHIAVGAFSAGGNMLTARRAMTGGAGTQTAGLIAGGYVTALMNNTEEYNGNGWSSSGNLPTALYYISVAGTQTAGLAIGGGDPVKQETLEYNGSAWTDVGNAPEIRKMLGRAGTQTASLFAGGNDGPNAASSEAFIYDGTNFTNITDLPSNRGAGHVSGGSQTASVHAGGSLGPPGLATTTVEWDGSSWSEGGSYPLPGQNQHSSNPSGYNQFVGGGTTSGAVTNKTLFYDGSTWSALANMGTARQQGAGFGSETAAAFCGGTTGSVTTATEEFNVTTSTITGAAWASGGNMTSGRGGGGDCGIYTAGLVFGGNPGEAPYTTANSEEYNGSAWSEGNNLGHAASDVSGAGTQTAAVAFAFSDNPTASTQEYNGTSWSEVNDLPGNQAQGRGIGIQTAALLVGYGSPGVATSEYDGTNWTAGGNHNNKRSGQKPGGWGTQTSAILASGYQAPPAVIITNTELYNGTSWTETGHAVVQGTKRTSATTAGTSTSGMLMGGGIVAGDNTTSSLTQAYNGTVWVTSANLATARINPQGFGTTSNAVVCGATNATEEFTGEFTTVNASRTIDFD